MHISPLRQALGAHLGQVLTPELDCAIEMGQESDWPDFLDLETGKFLACQLPPEQIRVWIATLSDALYSLGGVTDFDKNLKHTFLDGMYMRELFIPKGTLLVGKVHRLSCVNVVAKGDISVLTEHGSARVTAGHTAVSEAGIQKAGYAHEDTVFLNIFRTDETRIEAIEDTVAMPSAFRELPVHIGRLT